MSNIFLAFASLNGALAILAGAISFHGLTSTFGIHDKEIFHVAVDYQINNSLCLLVVGLMCKIKLAPLQLIHFSGCSLTLGIIFFCGTLYLKYVFNTNLPSLLIPIGGAFLILGWVSLLLASLVLTNKMNQ